MAAPLAEELLKGAKAIADELGLSRSEVYRLADRKLIPVKRIGGRLYAQRSELRRAFSVTAD